MAMEPDLLQTIESPPTASAISRHSVLVELSIQIGDVSRVRQGAICVERLSFVSKLLIQFGQRSFR